jgi:DASH complex subunit SPC19
MDTSTTTALSGCVTALHTSMSLLSSSIAILSTGVDDYPRLSRVLHTTRHFELISSHDLTTAQSTLLSEIKPEVDVLLSRVETYLDKLERKEKGLIAKAELQEGRLGQRRQSEVGKSPARGLGKAVGVGGSMEEVRAQQLRAKKERLSYAVGRLELQASQRQRQLRKSMAVQNLED